MNNSLDDTAEVALVTGAAAGMGLAAARSRPSARPRRPHEVTPRSAGLTLVNSRRLALFAAAALVGLSSCDTGARVQTATSAPAADLQRRGDQPAGKKMRVTI